LVAGFFCFGAHLPLAISSPVSSCKPPVHSPQFLLSRVLRRMHRLSLSSSLNKPLQVLRAGVRVNRLSCVQFVIQTLSKGKDGRTSPCPETLGGQWGGLLSWIRPATAPRRNVQSSSRVEVLSLVLGHFHRTIIELIIKCEI